MSISQGLFYAIRWYALEETQTMPLLQLTRNHADHCTDRGYQFEFFCDRCGNGFISEFQHFVMSMAGGAGGGHSGSTAPSPDKVFLDAVEEARPHFRQCPGCGQWVCAAACWNAGRALCGGCASTALDAPR
jgi:ribosomal protein S27AE